MQLDGALMRGQGLHGPMTPAMSTDEGVRVLFEVEPVKVGNAWRDREMITILMPGDMKSAPRRPLRDFDKKRFAAQYEAWKEGKKSTEHGTPLAAAPGLYSPAQIKTFEFYNIYTLEELASVNDNLLDQIGMGARSLRQTAQDYLEAMQGGDVLKRLEEDSARKDGEIEFLKQQMAAMQEALRASTEAQQQAVGDAYATAVLNKGADLGIPMQHPQPEAPSNPQIEASEPSVKIASIPLQPPASKRRQPKKGSTNE